MVLRRGCEMEWQGRPTSLKSSLVRVFLRNGSVMVGRYNTFDWNHIGHKGDIVKYQEVEDVLQPNGVLKQYWWLAKFNLPDQSN